MKQRAIFLDRDGVLNRAMVREGKPYPPHTLAELEILASVPDALHRLRQAGYLLIVVTNQPDVARGTQRREVVEAMNDVLRQTLPLDEILVCYEDGKDCPTRKPNPGFLLQSADKYNLDLSACYMIGDRWRDVEAGQRAGCKTVFLDQDYREPKPATPPDYTTGTLAEAANWILNGSAERRAEMKTLKDLKVKIYADGADKAGMLEMYRNPLIKGFTTNPTLMRKAGIADYEAFARDVLTHIADRPVSFEVFSDEFEEMEEQARRIATWGRNVYVKIPVTKTETTAGARPPSAVQTSIT